MDVCQVRSHVRSESVARGTRAVDLASALAGRRFAYCDEKQLQEAIGRLLGHLQVAHVREVRLGATDRIDFLVDRVGVEVKVKGAAAAVQRQLQRYARSALVDELLLVTTTFRHLNMPEDIGGKPLTVVALIGVDS